MSLLEPEYKEAFHTWKADPRPEHAARLLHTVAPAIDRAVRMHVGAGGPLIKSRARVMALEGLRRYDPSRARLGTFLAQHLQGLKRVNRAQTTALAVPERVALDRYHLGNEERRFTDERGRDPSDGELADFTGFALSRVRRARSYRPAVAEGTLEAAMGEPFAGGASRGHGAVWEQLVYDGLTPTEQRLVDYHKAGLPNQEIARRLGVTPGAISQRKKKIQQLFDEGEELSPFG